MIQTAMIIGTDGTLWAMELGTRKIADPIMVPTTIAVESNRPSLRGSSARSSMYYIMRRDDCVWTGSNNPERQRGDAFNPVPSLMLRVIRAVS